MTSIRFGTDGWRAIIAEDFTFANVRAVVCAIARYLKKQGKGQHGVVVGYDTRFLSDAFAREAACVLDAHGIPVLMVKRPTPTPLVAFAVVYYGADGAIMFTASHNPPQYNGIKFIPDYGGPATPDITRGIEAELPDALREAKTLRLPEAPRAEAIDVWPAYVRHLDGLVDWETVERAALSAVVDPMYGAGQGLVRELLAARGWTVNELHGTRDPLFGGHLPEPTEAHLTALRDAVVAGGAHLGLANDGDADRFGVVDGDGTYVTPNQVLVLLAHHLLARRGWKGALVRTVATTHLLDRVAERFGVPLVETPVGFKYVGDAMRRGPVVVGGEESGGLSVLGHIPEKDGILANCLIAEVRAAEGRPLRAALADLEREYGRAVHKRLDLHLPDDAKRTVVEGLCQAPPSALAGRRVREVRTVDGVKLLLEGDAWVLVRPSGTEPLLRVYLEAEAEVQLVALEEAVRALTARAETVAQGRKG